MSAVIPSEVSSQSDLETLQESSQSSNNKSDADKSNPSTSTPTPIAGDSTDCSEEFTLAEDCTQPLLGADETPNSPNTSEQSRERTYGTNDDNTPVEPIRNRFAEVFRGRLYSCVRKIRNSKLILVVLFLLIALPISAIYMGSRNMDNCPMSKDLPIIVIVMGAIGLFLIFARLITHGVRRFRCLEGIEEQTTLTVTGVLLLVSLSLLEIVMLAMKTPEFTDPTSEIYCDVVFYYYIFYMNFALLGIAFIATLLHIPGNCLRPVVEVHQG